VTGIFAVARVRRVLAGLVLATCLVIAGGASAASRSILGRWETVRTCRGLVISARLAGLSPIAPVIVGDYFPGKTPRQLARKRHLCSGAKPQLHSHFFSRKGVFGSLDQNDHFVDSGSYHVINAHIVSITSKGLPGVRFRYRIALGQLTLVPLLSKQLKRQTLRHPLKFGPAAWAVSMSYLAHRWQRVPCGKLLRGCNF
jgi:hypothetical protein